MSLTAKETAEEIRDLCKAYGWEYDVRGDILEISKEFTPGDNDALVTADMEYGSILGLLPTTRPGSTWGTDCGGVGAISALKNGYFVMKKSGGSKRVLNALAKFG
jgi:hypothetical protein